MYTISEKCPIMVRLRHPWKKLLSTPSGPGESLIIPFTSMQWVISCNAVFDIFRLKILYSENSVENAA